MSNCSADSYGDYMFVPNFPGAHSRYLHAVHDHSLSRSKPCHRRIRNLHHKRRVSQSQAFGLEPSYRSRDSFMSGTETPSSRTLVALRARQRCFRPRWGGRRAEVRRRSALGICGAQPLDLRLQKLDFRTGRDRPVVGSVARRVHHRGWRGWERSHDQSGRRCSPWRKRRGEDGGHGPQRAIPRDRFAPQSSEILGRRCTRYVVVRGKIRVRTGIETALNRVLLVP
jgi:hypothetical protein